MNKETKVIVCCGSGGVGKTTISAALGVAQALAGLRACVVTIDPARRLADSLGIQSLGNHPQPIELSSLSIHEGSLHGMMLDAHGTFDDIIHKFSKSPESAQKLMQNRYYQFASSRLGGSHEYMAMHKLLEVVDSNEFDIVILDTPPTQQALEFIAAPDKMRGLMDQGVLRWLVMPASRSGWRALELGSELLAKALKKLLGTETVSEIGEFFETFQEHWAGFRKSSERAQVLLRSKNTAFILVTAPTPIARDEALGFRDVLKREDLPLDGFVVNRFLPSPTSEASSQLSKGEGNVVDRELDEAMQRRRTQSESHAKVIRSLGVESTQQWKCWTVPEQFETLHTIEGLAQLAPHLPCYVTK